jgi:hypothetical protein
MSASDTSPDYIAKVLAAAPFADQDAGVPQMAELIRALSSERNELRDRFAGQALSGLCANTSWQTAASWKVTNLSMSMAVAAYIHADAMLAAREVQS